MDHFTRSYVETALWSSTDEFGEPLDAVFGVEDLAPATLAAMQSDCTAFQSDYADDIASGPGRAGQDFWLTRCRHGAGFSDDGWSDEVGKRLTEAAHAYGHLDLYAGDDGLIYVTFPACTLPPHGR